MEVGRLVKPDICRAGPDDSLAEAARLMHSHHCGSAIVPTDEGPDIITERDILRAVAEGRDLAVTRVGDFMSSPAVRVPSDTDYKEAARMMLDRGFRHLIVVGADGEVEGVLSIRDLLHTLLGAGVGA